MKIKYLRWDGEIIDLDIAIEDVVGTLPQNVVDLPEEVSVDSSSISVGDHGNKLYIAIKMPKGMTSTEEIQVDYEDFIEKIGGFDLSATITVDSLESYISALEYYRAYSLKMHVMLLCQHGERINSSLPNKDGLLHAIDALIDYFSCATQRSRSCTMVEGTLEELVKDLNKFLCNGSCNETNDESGILYEIARSIRLYLQGNCFCYYRGVSKPYYKEIPGIFRGNKLMEEDRWYRQMKVNFQDQLDQKHYLDRLAMLQHYELPTRLLDVTTNPLVALYMVTNTIYTNDKKMLGYGEVIVYFDDYSQVNDNGNVPADNRYGNEATYVYDGKAYDSSVVLLIAALVKLKYENKHRMFRVISTFRELIALIYAHKQDEDEYQRLAECINFCIHCCAEHFEQKYVFTTVESAHFKVQYGIDISTPFDICKYIWSEAQNVEGFSYASRLYTDDEIFTDDFLKFISSYRYLLTTVRRENSAFIDHVNVFDLLKSYHVKVGMTNERIQAQAGSFIICGLDEDYVNSKMNCSRRSECMRLIIKNKKKIAKQLNAIGINDTSIIPDMAHHAGYMKRQLDKGNN